MTNKDLICNLDVHYHVFDFDQGRFWCLSYLRLFLSGIRLLSKLVAFFGILQLHKGLDLFGV